MTALATQFKAIMSKRDGYMSIPQFMEKDIVEYTFDNLFKVHSSDFSEWVVYWEGSPVAVRCKVVPQVLANGHIRVGIFKKDLVAVDVVGEYTYHTNQVMGSFFGDKFGNARKVSQLATDYAKDYLNGKVVETAPVQNKASDNAVKEVQRYTESKVISSEEATRLKELMAKNWGVSLK